MGEHDDARSATFVGPQHRQGRQCGEVQAIDADAAALGFQADVSGCDQQVVDVDSVAARPAELVSQCGRVRGDMVKAGNQAQRLQAAVRCRIDGMGRARAERSWTEGKRILSI